MDLKCNATLDVIRAGWTIRRDDIPFTDAEIGGTTHKMTPIPSVRACVGSFEPLGHLHGKGSRSRRPVEGRTDPECRLVIPDLIHPIHDLDPLHCAPAGHEGARERFIREAD